MGSALLKKWDFAKDCTSTHELCVRTCDDSASSACRCDVRLCHPGRVHGSDDVDEVGCARGGTVRVPNRCVRRVARRGQHQPDSARQPRLHCCVGVVHPGPRVCRVPREGVHCSSSGSFVPSSQ